MSKNAQTNHDIAPYIVTEQYLADHRVDNLRSGEGCVHVLNDNTLMAVYGIFAGGSDHDKAKLVKQISADNGKTWSKPKLLIKSPASALNLMSLSTLRLADGRIAMIYLRKESLKDCRPCFVTSSDEGKTWSKPVEVISKKDNGYYVGNNDRLVQLESGRLLMPVCFHGNDIKKNFGHGICGCVFSDDAGVTWQLASLQGIEPQNVAKPRFIDKNHTEMAKLFKEKQLVCQEPGVIELPNGNVMMWARTNGGYMYTCISKDDGLTFTPFKAERTFAMPCGPQSIKRIPVTDRLLMLYNDRHDIPMGDYQFNWRRTLDVAVSDDNAKTWRRLGTLEPGTVPSTCYYSICFHKKNVVFTYYEGHMHNNGLNKLAPTNLRSLKLKVVKQAYFMQ